jgi:uncharacterized membrane protein
MNKMLVAIFDSETAADAGLKALRKLDGTGDITLYATGVMVKDAKGKITALSRRPSVFLSLARSAWSPKLKRNGSFRSIL